jgi:uncharacterized membrane protein YhiD involved in acid resistance
MENIYQHTITGLVLIVSFFLGKLYDRFSKLEEKNNSLEKIQTKHEEKIETITDRIPQEINNLKTIMDLHYTELRRAVQHTEKTIANQAETFVKILEELQKK